MLKAIDKWFPGYLASVGRRPRNTSGLRHLIFCLVDHFEPVHWEPDPARRGPAVRDWVDHYRNAMASFRDAEGRVPQHTFFYPAEDADPESLNPLAEACRAGLGEVEIHLHHRNDTAAGLAGKLTGFRDLLRREYGLLGTDATGRIRYGFIHGNWALCNSRPDGDWCGVNEELTVLSETGCYADFTFPSAPSPTQPRMVNALYLARDREGRSRSTDEGARCQVGIERGEEPSAERIGPGVGRDLRASREGGRSSLLSCSVAGWRARVLASRGDGARRVKDEEGRMMEKSGTTERPSHISRQQLNNPQRPTGRDLLIIQGPLGINFRRRKWGFLPRLENGALTRVNPPTPERVDLWVRQGIHVIDRPEWIFVKVHTHGFEPGCRPLFTGGGLVDFHRDLQRRYNDGVKWRLHYVTARETANLVRAAMAGKGGDPGEWRDFEVRPPPFR